MAPPSACAKCRRELKGCCSGGLRLRRGPKPTTRRPRRASAPGGVDRIGALPDDLLLEVLVRLRCARAAAHATLLARRWRGLWARLPELAFHGVAPDPLDAALARTPRASGPLSVLDITVPCHHSPVDSARVSSWLQAAAALAPANLVISDAIVSASSGVEVELPCFYRAASITLRVFGARFVLRPAGSFPALESLSLEDCHIDHGDLLRRCPRLRKLRILDWDLGSITIHSPSLEELDVHATRRPSLTMVHLHRVDIMTPALKKLRFHAYPAPMTGLGGANDFTLLYSAPMVEELHWWCTCGSTTDHRFGVIWWLRNLTLKTVKPSGHMGLQLEHRPRVVHTLSLCISLPIVVSLLNFLLHFAAALVVNEMRNFGQEISQIPVTNFEGLVLNIETEGHVYGAMVLHLLGVCNFIQSLRFEKDAQ
ncbi:hypothetical protein ACP70R_023064 [Stipagrostis hirtigluma subsp. patula]